MKKSLLALAALGAFAGAASAQSSVTLFGVVDLSVAYSKTGNHRLISEDSNQLNSNRIGFKGVEDLGGGLKAGFWLEAGMSNDTGTGASTGGGLQFNRRSTVSLLGNFGEVRLGRDYTPTFWNIVLYDVFGANGIASGENLMTVVRGAVNTPTTATVKLGDASTSVVSTTVRANNSVTYFLPSNIGGFYGRAMVAGSEGTSGGKYYGGTLNWAGGPIDVGAGYSTTKVIGANDYKNYNAGGSYDFGVAKIFALYNVVDADPGKLKTAEVSVGIPVGVGAINVAYTHAAYSNLRAYQTNAQGKADQLGGQYIYNLSKRTALYGGVSYIRNKDNASFSVGNALAAIPGDNMKAVNVGVRHSF